MKEWIINITYNIKDYLMFLSSLIMGLITITIIMFAFTFIVWLANKIFEQSLPALNKSKAYLSCIKNAQSVEKRAFVNKDLTL